jgi:hypothetical protein
MVRIAGETVKEVVEGHGNELERLRRQSREFEAAGAKKGRSVKGQGKRIGAAAGDVWKAVG